MLVIQGRGGGAASLVLKAPRLIVAHAGSYLGFIPVTVLIFKSQTENGDYHGEVNFDNYDMAAFFLPFQSALFPS
jgi:hypothetical protein